MNNRNIIATLLFILFFSDIKSQEVRNFNIQTWGAKGVNDMSLSSDGNFLVTCGYACQIKLWDFKTGRNIRNFGTNIKQKYSIKSIAFSPDNKYIVSAGSNTIKLWNVKTGQEIRTFKDDHNVYGVAHRRQANT